MATNSWTAYEPDSKAPWNLRRVVHLHRRAAFAACWDEIERDRKDGPQVSIDRLLKGREVAEGVPANFAETALLLADSAVGAADAGRLKATWIYRMLFGPDPLAERLTLLWHNHFATSNLKVDDLGAMRRQNEHLRELGRKHFGELLKAAVREPALLVWLDAPSNRKGHPNENLARELMELFTLGIGHFTETDVKEAARALTGWTVANEAFAELPARHDDGAKTILGKTGSWNGADLVRILLEQPATAERLAFRICQWLMGEKTVDPTALKALAAGLREHELDIAWGVETVLRSRAFFCAANLGQRILGPVEFVIGAVRALEMFEPPPSTLILAEWATRLGQDLFYPPNVGGWPGGRSWLTTRSALGRTRFALALVEGPGIGRPQPLDARGLARRHGVPTDRDGLIAFFTRLLLGREPTPEWRDRLIVALDQATDADAVARKIVALILSSPEAQLS